MNFRLNWLFLTILLLSHSAAYVGMAKWEHTMYIKRQIIGSQSKLVLISRNIKILKAFLSLNRPDIADYRSTSYEYLIM